MTSARQPFWPSLAVAALLHGAAFAWVASRPAPRLQPRRPPTTVRLVARERPAPPAAAPAPAPAPPSKPAPRPPPRPEPRLAKAVERPSPPPPPAAPVAPAPTPAPAQAAPPQPRRFAVSMGATAPGGGVAVPVTGGPTAARGDPSLPASAPVGDNLPFATRRPADVTEVERAPRPLRQPSGLELRALYPEAARREGLEGDVRLELLVDERGAVAEVRVTGRAGHGFDEVAPEAARRLVFSPAERGGRPVAVRIPWTLKFRLDG